MATIGIPNPVELRGISYYVRPLEKGVIDAGRQNSLTTRPATVISSARGDVCASEISDLITNFLTIDDVYSLDFLSTIVIQTLSGIPNNCPIGQGVCQGFTNNTECEIEYATATSLETLLPSGPYFVYSNGIYEAWRLYPDYLSSFEVTVIPDAARAMFSVLTTLEQDGVWKNVAVPSRLYTKSSVAKPLAGARISVKGNFKLAGIKTTMTNRCYTELYPVENETAVFVEKLVELGAIIVGKTWMCSFASGEEPTDQWIDFHCPFNPRGDTYQTPGSSSSGAGASIAGYPWLDYSIGTDTAGSIRAPAACNGVYGLRPSFGISPMSGIFHLARPFDTIGLLGRDLASLGKLAELALDVAQPKRLPTRILYPADFFPTSNSNQQAMLDDYVSTLESFLGVKRTEISFVRRWSECPPPSANGTSLKDFLNKSPHQQYYYDAYHESDAFRGDYRQRFGKEAYVGPIVRFRWDIGAGITRDVRDQAEANLAVFREWFHENVLQEQADTLSDAVLVMPEGKAIPNYRDDVNPSPSILGILGENTIAMVLGLPHLVLPIGQMAYKSRVSGIEEYRPISASLIGAKGSDGMLFKLALAAFEKAGWPTKVQTGRYTFPLGPNIRNVGAEYAKPKYIPS